MRLVFYQDIGYWLSFLTSYFVGGQFRTIYLTVMMHYSSFFLCVQGKLKCDEHVTIGFENMFDAFLGIFRRDNIGKAVVKA